MTMSTVEDGAGAPLDTGNLPSGDALFAARESLIEAVADSVSPTHRSLAVIEERLARYRSERDALEPSRRGGREDEDRLTVLEEWSRLMAQQLRLLKRILVSLVAEDLAVRPTPVRPDAARS